MKSSYSNSSCVDVAYNDGCMVITNTRFPDGAPLIFTVAEWDAFVAGIRGGEFDALVPPEIARWNHQNHTPVVPG